MRSEVTFVENEYGVVGRRTKAALTALAALWHGTEPPDAPVPPLTTFHDPPPPPGVPVRSALGAEEAKLDDNLRQLVEHGLHIEALKLKLAYVTSDDGHEALVVMFNDRRFAMPEDQADALTHSHARWRVSTSVQDIRDFFARQPDVDEHHKQIVESWLSHVDSEPLPGWEEAPAAKIVDLGASD